MFNYCLFSIHSFPPKIFIYFFIYLKTSKHSCQSTLKHYICTWTTCTKTVGQAKWIHDWLNKVNSLKKNLNIHYNFNSSKCFQSLLCQLKQFRRYIYPSGSHDGWKHYINRYYRLTSWLFWLISHYYCSGQCHKYW